MADSQMLIDIARDIQTIIKQLEEAPTIVQQSRDELRVSESALSRAEARAFLGTSGTVKERDARVALECADLRDDVEVARAAFDYSRSLVKSLESRLGGLQTLGAIARMEMRL